MSVINHKDLRDRRGQKEDRQGPLVVVTEMFSDPITRAVVRNRELRRTRVPECETVWDHVFRCVCCGKVRGDQERQGPTSELCVRCVSEAGFFN